MHPTSVKYSAIADSALFENCEQFIKDNLSRGPLAQHSGHISNDSYSSVYTSKKIRRRDSDSDKLGPWHSTVVKLVTIHILRYAQLIIIRNLRSKKITR